MDLDDRRRPPAGYRQIGPAAVGDCEVALGAGASTGEFQYVAGAARPGWDEDDNGLARSDGPEIRQRQLHDAAMRNHTADAPRITKSVISEAISR
jgi:hypothetical protein